MDTRGITFITVPIPNTYLLASPVPDDGELILIASPAKPNSRIEVLSIDVICADQLAVDGTDAVLVGTIVFHDSSADADTTLFTGAAGAAGDLLTVRLDLNEADNLWSGVQSLDPGDSIRAVLTVTTPDTPGQGYAFIVGYRVKEWNGQ